MIVGFVVLAMALAFGVLVVSVYNGITYREATVLTVDYIRDAVREGINWIKCQLK